MFRWFPVLPPRPGRRQQDVSRETSFADPALESRLRASPAEEDLKGRVWRGESETVGRIRSLKEIPLRAALTGCELGLFAE